MNPVEKIKKNVDEDNVVFLVKNKQFLDLRFKIYSIIKLDAGSRPLKASRCGKIKIFLLDLKIFSNLRR